MKLLCFVTLLFFSCSSPQKESSKNVFHINISGGYLESLDPAFAKDLYMIWLTHAVYNRLVETDEHLHTVPSLAKTWDVSPDGLTWTFHLRNDVYFQDNPAFKDGKGRLLDAGDVVYSFNRIIDPHTASPGAWIFNEHVRKAQPFAAIDDTTVQIHLARPFRPLPEILTIAYCGIVPHEVAERWGKDFRNHPCGTGPFMFGYWDEGNALVLHRNPHYWEHDSAGNRLPYMDAVQFSFIDSKATEFLLFMQGKLDFVNGIDGSFKDLVLSKDGTLKPEYRNKFQFTRGNYMNTEYIGFLSDSSLPAMQGASTGNPLIRQAINYAIDRRKIVTYFKNGMGIPATHGFIPAGMPGYDSDARYGYIYDPARARQLLAQAGYPNGAGLKPMNILVQDNYVDIVNFIAGELRDVGIPASIEVMQPNILRQEMARSKAVAFRAQWIADYPDAETFLVVFNSNFPAPPNYTRFHNDSFNKWYDESLNLPDTARWRLYRRMDSLAMMYAPVLPLYYDERLHFTQNTFTGFRSNPMNVIDLRYVKFNSSALK